MEKKSLVLLMVGVSACMHAQPSRTIYFYFGTNTVSVELNDSPAATALLAQLPLTLKFEDYQGMEKIAYPPKKLPTEGASGRPNPAAGDFYYYAPWGDIIFFYKNATYSSGLIPLGKIISGQSLVPTMKAGERVEIRQ